MNPYVALSALSLAAAPAVAQEPETPHRYAPEELIRAEFSLSERTREGGRITPFFTSYRPFVSIEGGARVICRFVVDTQGGHKPGTTGPIGMTCPIAVTEGQRFLAYERQRPIGSGVVLPRN